MAGQGEPQESRRSRSSGVRRSPRRGLSLKVRSYRRDNSQHHAEGVEVTPFAGLEPVHDGDSADNAASRAGLLPADPHVSPLGVLATARSPAGTAANRRRSWLTARTPAGHVTQAATGVPPSRPVQAFPLREAVVRVQGPDGCGDQQNVRAYTSAWCPRCLRSGGCMAVGRDSADSCGRR